MLSVHAVRRRALQTSASKQARQRFHVAPPRRGKAETEQADERASQAKMRLLAAGVLLIGRTSELSNCVLVRLRGTEPVGTATGSLQSVLSQKACQATTLHRRQGHSVRQHSCLCWREADDIRFGIMSWAVQIYIERVN